MKIENLKFFRVDFYRFSLLTVFKFSVLWWWAEFYVWTDVRSSGEMRMQMLHDDK